MLGNTASNGTRTSENPVVASELLFDLRAIDLNRVALSAEDVGKINPQAGPMRQLDHVIWFSDDLRQSLGVKQITEDEFWVPHHIPGRPMMPGVLMIEAAAQASSVLYQQRVDEPRFVGFTRCDQTVFRKQVVPGDTLYLLTEEVDFRKRRFICATQAVVNDELAFESRITGMVI